MTISSITGLARPTSAKAASTSNPDSAPARASATAAAQPEQPFRTPTPPRFPWLSRLADELQSASNQRAAFAPAPVLGDHLDKSA